MERLYHIWCETKENFFNRIDEYGGWPLNKKYVVFKHVVECERPCYFTDQHIHNEWYTTLYSCDEYYWWKISDKGKGLIEQDIISKFKNKIDRL